MDQKAFQTDECQVLQAEKKTAAQKTARTDMFQSLHVGIAVVIKQNTGNRRSEQKRQRKVPVVVQARAQPVNLIDTRTTKYKKNRNDGIKEKGKILETSDENDECNQKGKTDQEEINKGMKHVDQNSLPRFCQAALNQQGGIIDFHNRKLPDHDDDGDHKSHICDGRHGVPHGEK